MTIANPAAGTWVVLVDGFAVPAGHDDLQLRRRVRQPGVRLGQRDRRQRPAAGRLVVDRAGLA